MALREVQVDGGLFQIPMAQQDLDGAEICTCFQEMSGEAVAQRVWVHVFLDARLLGGFLTRLPNRFRIDRRITAMVAVAWKQPCAWLALQSAPVFAQRLQ